MKTTIMATPWADPRTGRLYLRRQIPAKLRAAFGGRALYKVALGTSDPAAARPRFAAENASFEQLLADARRRVEDGTLAPDPKALVRRWLQGAAVEGRLPAHRRQLATLLSLDMAACEWMGVHSRSSLRDGTVDRLALSAAPELLDEVVRVHYEDEPERVGSWWWGVRWCQPEAVWRPFLDAAVDMLKAFDVTAAAHGDRALADALLAEVDRLCPEDARAGVVGRKRPKVSRLRPTMRLGQLLSEWKAGRGPSAQTAAEYARVVEDFIEFHGDVAAAAIDADMIYDFRDAVAKLPKAMPRKDRELPFTRRVATHEHKTPKAEPSTVKKAVGGVQALLTYGFQMRWLQRNEGRGVHVEGYSKVNRRHRRSFQDAEITRLFGSPLFVEPASWAAGGSRFSGSTLFWLFLIGARLEEIGQAALADVGRDGEISFLDIDDRATTDVAEKHVKTDGSLRLVPIHDELVRLGFLRYLEALRAAGHAELFPDLTPGAFGKRTNTVSQRINRIIDAVVGDDRRLVFHSFRHSFKALGTDAGISPRVLDQICGHAPVDVASRYGSEPRIGTIHRELHRISFPIPWPEIAAAVAGVDWIAEVGRLSAERRGGREPARATAAEATL